MGGWNEGSQNYSIVAADSAKRAVLIGEVLSFLQKHNFHGIDFDWNYPGVGDGANEAEDSVSYFFLIASCVHSIQIDNMAMKNMKV